MTTWYVALTPRILFSMVRIACCLWAILMQFGPCSETQSKSLTPELTQSELAFTIALTRLTTYCQQYGFPGDQSLLQSDQGGAETARLVTLLDWVITENPAFGDHILGMLDDSFICGNGICETFVGESPQTCPVDCPNDPVILDASIEAPPLEPFPSHGDIWMSTWAEDDALYLAWGDGCGPGLEESKPLCAELYRDSGVARLTGDPPWFTNCAEPEHCVAARGIPNGVSMDTNRDDKPSSLLALDGRLLWAGHSPLWEPRLGYLAVSDDSGEQWQEVFGSPWRIETASPFRCLMFIAMGRNYELNQDGYVYALGIGWEWDWDVIGDGKVYLARVLREGVADYNSYEYLSGYSLADEPIWSGDQASAAPVRGLLMETLSSAMYHPGLERYLVMTNYGIFEAMRPWGPYLWTARLLLLGDDPAWRGGYMPGLIAKGMTPESFFFSLAGNDQNLEYRFHIGRVIVSTQSQQLP